MTVIAGTLRFFRFVRSQSRVQYNMCIEEAKLATALKHAARKWAPSSDLAWAESLLHRRSARFNGQMRQGATQPAVVLRQNLLLAWVRSFLLAR
eukprot:6178306-Pleurochrysis_carterae.AAC.1